MVQFRKNNREHFLPLLSNIISSTEQSRTLLFLGNIGWGKTACALDIAQLILKENPLTSSNFFYFRNDNCALKTEFFLKHCPNTPEAWTWLYLLQRRINMIAQLDEKITMPTGIKLTSIKEQLDEIISTQYFPKDEKFISQLTLFTQTLNKKSGVPVNVIRECIKFHSVHSTGRVSLISDFDTADTTSQNAILKLIEEPNPNHWIVLTAQNENSLLPTILSRTLKFTFKKPLPSDLIFLGENSQNITSSLDIMKESLYKLSHIKNDLLNQFFDQCTKNIEYGIDFIQFSEQLGQQNLSSLFLEELHKCFEDALRLRQSKIRDLTIPLNYPQYQAYSSNFSNATVAELEELVSTTSRLYKQLSRTVIKDDYILPAFLLEISRTLRKIH